jgi:hypothetical protein
MDPTVEPTPAHWTRRWQWVALALAVLVASWLALGHFAAREHADHSDEPEWIAISILHWRQLVLGEPPAGAELDPPEVRSANPWKQGVQRTVFGAIYPCRPKLVWGAALHAAGYREASPRAFEVFSRGDDEANRAARAELEPAMPLARRIVLLLAALCAAQVFFVGRALVRGPLGWLCAALAWALFIASPLVLNTATYIRTDYFMLAFALATLLLALRLRAALAGLRGARAQALAAAAAGALAGLAVSGKPNGALVGLCVALWIPLGAWLRRRLRAADLRAIVVALALSAIAALGVFWLLDPVLWRDPIGEMLDIRERWDRQLAVQTSRAAGMGFDPAEHTSGRIASFVERLGTFDSWSSLTGLPGGRLLLAGGLVLLVVSVARGRARAERADEGQVAGTVVVYALLFMIGSAVILPLHWGRFLLPTAPGTALLQAVCVTWVAGRVGSGVLRLRRGRS